MKHTPGPWVLVKNPKTNWYDLRIVEAEWSFGGIYGENAEANACLIAAAPEMLECLIRAYKDMDNIDSVCFLAGVHSFDLMRTDLKQIIEKATGMTIEEVMK